MNMRYLFGATLLGLASCFSARAQAPVVGSTPAATPAAGTAPSNVMANPVPASATTPTSPETAAPLYSNGVPTRNVDAGTQRADQPVYGNGEPAVTGSHATRSLNRKRTSTTQP